jgi:GT2 family glycosyltransferase
VGGFDEEMFILFEDLALSYALKLSGGSVAVAEDAICLHKSGTAGLSTRGPARSYAGRRTFLHSRNRWIFLLTHYRLRTLVLLAPAFLLYGMVHLGFALASGHVVAWLRGKLALLGLCRYLRGRRRLIQGLRVRGDGELLTCSELTFNPGLAERGVRGVANRVLTRVLALYHAGVRRML